MSIAYDVTTATVAATMAGNEFAVAAFIHPQLYKLNETSHASAAAAFARILGKYMPLWYALALLLMLGATYQHRPQPPPECERKPRGMGLAQISSNLARPKRGTQ